MKEYFSTALVLACIGLVIAVVVTGRNDRARHENDVSIIEGFSNQLSSAKRELTVRQESILTFSNDLHKSQADVTTLSNRLMEAESNLARDRKQVTNLTIQVAQAKSEKQALAGRIVNLTRQVAALTERTASAEDRLKQSTKDWTKNYSLLEDRLRSDVAQRLIVERRFNNVSALQLQLERLKKNPAWPLSAKDIYAGLGIEVESNGAFQVLSPD